MACIICKSAYALEEHHEQMQAEGGTSGRTLFLCSNCHVACHQQARALKSKNPKINNKQYFPLELRQRAYPVVQGIISGSLVYETKKDRLHDHAISSLQIPISPRQLARLHIQKQLHGYTNMEDFMSAIVVQITGVRAWPKGSNESDSPPTPQQLAMLKSNQ